MRLLFLFLIEAAAVICDYRDGKIPNMLILCGLILAGIWQWQDAHLHGIWYFLSGAAVPAVLLFPLHCFKMLGAGDVKLLMVSGSFFGPSVSIKILIVTFLTAAVLSVAVLIKHHILKQRLEYFTQYLQRLFTDDIWEPYIGDQENPAYIHVSLPIFLAALLTAGGVI